MENPPVISEFLRGEFQRMGARIVSDKLVAFLQDAELDSEELNKKGLIYYATTGGRTWYWYTGTPDEM